MELKYSSKNRTVRTLEATVMDLWRRAAGKSRVERITNNRIREIMSINRTIFDNIRTQQLKWYDHVQRTSYCQNSSGITKLDSTIID